MNVAVPSVVLHLARQPAMRAAAGAAVLATAVGAGGMVATRSDAHAARGWRTLTASGAASLAGLGMAALGAMLLPGRGTVAAALKTTAMVGSLGLVAASIPDHSPMPGRTSDTAPATGATQPPASTSAAPASAVPAPEAPSPASPAPSIAPASPAPTAPAASEPAQPAPAGDAHVTADGLPASGTGDPLGIDVVQPGDQLFPIALRYEIATQDLRDLNRLASDVISPGQALNVPVGTQQRSVAENAAIVARIAIAHDVNAELAVAAMLAASDGDNLAARDGGHGIYALGEARLGAELAHDPVRSAVNVMPTLAEVVHADKMRPFGQIAAIALGVADQAGFAARVEERRPQARELLAGG